MDEDKRIGVLFLTLYTRNGASTRIRVLQFIPLLEQQGFTCTAAPLINLGGNQFFQKLIALPKRFFQVLFAKKYDVIFIQKDILMFGMNKLLHFLNKNIVYEFDDAIFSSEINADGLKGWVLKHRAKKFNRMIEISKHVIVENSYLADYVKEHFPDKPVTIINAPISLERYAPRLNRESDEIIIGWVGSLTTAPLLRLIEQPLAKICKKYQNVKIVLIGAPGFQANFPAMTKPWNEKTEVSELQNFDIGLMPLDDSGFNKGRFGYKLAQYMAVGIPYVRSNMGVHKNIDIELDKYCLAGSEKEWEEKLSRLIENKKLRERLGKRARKLAEERYDLRKYAKVMGDILKNLVENETEAHTTQIVK